MKKLLKNGNAKIDKSCMVFNLPTTICPVQCLECYAGRPEKFRPNVLPSRVDKYNRSLEDSFVADMVAEIKKNKRGTFRIHESGDFYSQDYVDKWFSIMQACPGVKFYAYTKTRHLFNFSCLDTLDNFNPINSNTDHGPNYGPMEYCKQLVAEGYTLCPCGIDTSAECMKTCSLCLDHTRVCFLQH